MQQHRQAVALRERQLGAVEVLLARHVQAGHPSVQADFTHRHQVRVALGLGQGLVQGQQIRLLGLWGEQRVDAQRISVAMRRGQFPHPLEIGRLHGGPHAQTHPSLARPRAHRRQIGGKFRRVQVAVGVDPNRHIKVKSGGSSS